jgi:hypothetical protein
VKRRRANSDDGARAWYQDGPADYYREHGANYSNPHAPIVAACLDRARVDWNLDLTSVLDLACGAGEVTVGLQPHCKQIAGIDPFTHDAYTRVTGLPCERMTFEDISVGGLRGRSYSMIVCSFAMHLCPLSRLPALVMALSQIAPALLILSPHKRPAIRDDWGFVLQLEAVHQRVRTRIYTRQPTDLPI